MYRRVLEDLVTVAVEPEEALAALEVLEPDPEGTPVVLEADHIIGLVEAIEAGRLHADQARLWAVGVAVYAARSRIRRAGIRLARGHQVGLMRVLYGLAFATPSLDPSTPEGRAAIITVARAPDRAQPQWRVVRALIAWTLATLAWWTATAAIPDDWHPVAAAIVSIGTWTTAASVAALALLDPRYDHTARHHLSAPAWLTVPAIIATALIIWAHMA